MIEELTTEQFEVGDIAVCNWGYSMQLVNFYIVEKRTKANVWFKPIGSEIVNPDEWGQSGYKVPDTSVSGKTFRKKVKRFHRDSRSYLLQTGHEYTAADTYGGIITKWDGTPQRWDTYD